MAAEAQDGLAVRDGKAGGRAERQGELGGAVPKRQAAHDRNAGRLGDAIEGDVHVVAVVVLGHPVAREVAHQQGLLPTEHACVQQVVEHAFDAVRRLGDVLDEQQSAVDCREIGRTDEAAEHREVAAPQRALGRQIRRFRRRPLRHTFVLAEGVPEVRPGERIEFGRAEVGAKHGTTEGHDAALRIQRALQRSEIAVPHEGDRRVAQPIA